MKFLADMGISPATVATLRTYGHEATHLSEAGLHGLPDADILAKARREQAIVLTHDLDFGELMAASREPLPSVIIFRLPTCALLTSIGICYPSSPTMQTTSHRVQSSV